MTSRDFCFWLNGHLSLNPGKAMSADAVKLISSILADTIKAVTDEEKYLLALEKAKAVRCYRSTPELFMEAMPDVETSVQQ